jgi:hypothetical protein
VIYHLVICILVIQFRDTLVTHCNPHQFHVTTHGECETMVHGVEMMLNLHPDWVVLQVDVRNAFNSMSRSAIFQEIRFSFGSKSIFTIFSMIICMPILIIFFSSLLTWGSHSHFIIIKYTIKRPIRRSVICSSSPLHYSPYNNNPAYLCFFFNGGWHTYNRSCVKFGSFFYYWSRSFQH